MLNKSTLYIFVLLTITLFGCDKKWTWATDADCSECKLAEQKKDFINIEITLNSDNPVVPIEVYNGDINDNNLAFLDTAKTTLYKREVAIGNKYTFLAKYKSGNRIINAIDATILTTYNIEGECNIACWVVRNNKLDLRLKF